MKYRLLSEPEIGNLLGSITQQTENSNNAIGVAGNNTNVAAATTVATTTVTDNSSSSATSLNGKKNNILRT